MAKSKRREKRVSKKVAYLRRKLPALPSMSDTLLEFAAPLLDGLTTAEAFEPFLTMAMHLWNLSLVDEDLRAEEGEVAAALYRSDVISDLEEIVGASRQECQDMLEMMFERKRELFPDEWRDIISFQVIDTPGGVHVRVASRIL